MTVFVMKITFEFKDYPVPANDETKIRFLYYQPLKIGSGIGRYLYPLEEGGTDEAGMSFWTTNARVENTFSMNLMFAFSASCWVTAPIGR